MADKRTIDQLSIEDLERALAIKRRQERQARLQRMKQAGRIIDTNPPKPKPTEDPLAALDEMGPAHRNSSDAMGLPAQMITLDPSTRQISPSAPAFEDGVEPPGFAKRKNDAEQHIWRTFVNRSLLLVEVAAVVGLVALGVTMLQSITMLQDETAAVQAEADEILRAAMPTIEPTPQIRLINDIVLPGGHTPPIDGSSTFNFGELPEGMEYMMADQVYVPQNFVRQQASPQTAKRIRIPDIGIEAPIVQGTDWEALKLGVGQLPNGVTPDDGTGNLVLAAHNDIYGEIFRHIDQLEVGMEFEVVTDRQIYTYRVTGTDIVDPDDVHVTESRGYSMATLISCYPYQVNNKRYIVYAERIDV
ncbi:class D sortase [Phototrophicus methaneseepsis]|uniref:Class D sortase n=1 Tax=Phototrophicus methaneseepsis TaxID=2710758 RepID=A0A7S8E8W9_9CHLR|nr:class D sortase [Phototrophicus methaneseepsis]QPC82536.1 class D sortase [Phototrophicus methaneseepsis]